MGICRVKALIPAPLPRVWEYVIDPRNIPLWVPNIESVAGVDRPMQAGDRLTQWRRDFFRLERQELLVEEVIPYRSFRLRILSAKGRPLNATAAVSVEQAADPGATWVEEAIDYSLGKGAFVRGVERWLLDPVVRALVRRKSGRALRLPGGTARLRKLHRGGRRAGVDRPSPFGQRRARPGVPTRDGEPSGARPRVGSAVRWIDSLPGH